MTILENAAEMARRQERIDQWRKDGQPWRTELLPSDAWYIERLETPVDIPNRTFAFGRDCLPQDRKLSRAEIEDLLASHKDGSWIHSTGLYRPNLFYTSGLDLRGADLSFVDLSRLPLWETRGGLSYEAWKLAKEIDPKLRDAAGADFTGANLWRTRLDRSSLRNAVFKSANLRRTHFEGAALAKANFSGADLSGAYFDNASVLNGAIFYEEELGGARLVDVRWEGVNLTKINWGVVKSLGDDRVAETEKNVTNAKRIRNFVKAIRANRQLAKVLHGQGLSGVASRFSYRAEILSRELWKFELRHDTTLNFRQKRALAFSLGYSYVLSTVSGYGYRIQRTVIWYAGLVIAFAAFYFLANHQRDPFGIADALMMSMNSFHGRWLFQSGLNLLESQPRWITAAYAVESLLGLILQAVFIASLTQRFVRK